MPEDNIALGDGVISVGSVDIALTRGGGQFVVERGYKQISADGDYGIVKGRTRIISSQAKLTVNILELLPANITKFYPGLDRNTTDPNVDVITGTLEILDGDYNTVTWTGRTLAGKAIVITLENAINLENLDWSMVDKEEIIPVLTYSAAYDPAARTTEPWNISFYDNVDSVIPVATLLAPSAGAQTSIILEFNERLAAATLAITDRFNLLSALKNDAFDTAAVIAITTLANSVQWFNKTSSNPYCIITIASTTFVAGETVRANMKASAVVDVAGNEILAATNSDAIVIA